VEDTSQGTCRAKARMRVLPKRMKAQPGATPDGVGLARTIIASVSNEGAALFAVVTWMVGGRMLSLVALAVSLIGLLLGLPVGGSLAETLRPVGDRHAAE